MKSFLEFIIEARVSQASQKAQKLGFTGDGHGYWVDKQGEVKAQTVKGQLQFLDKDKSKKPEEEKSQNQPAVSGSEDSSTKAKLAPKRLGVAATQSPKNAPQPTPQKSTSGGETSKNQSPVSGDLVTVAFGKFNPPTKAHKNVLTTLKKTASGGNYYVFPSRSQDGKKNPLSPEIKIDFMKLMFPEFEDRILDSEEFKTIFDVLVFLNQEGYSDINIICGAERTSEIENLTQKQNGKLYQYNSINVISSGAKDPDSEENSSSARKSAATGDFETFKKAMPSGVNPKIIKQLFSELGGSLNVKETWQIAPELDSRGLRENYLFGKLFTVGNIVESCNTGLVGKILRCGANHLICVTESGVMFKSWIKDVSLV